MSTLHTHHIAPIIEYPRLLAFNKWKNFVLTAFIICFTIFSSLVFFCMTSTLLDLLFGISGWNLFYLIDMIFFFFYFFVHFSHIDSRTEIFGWTTFILFSYEINQMDTSFIIPFRHLCFLVTINATGCWMMSIDTTDIETASYCMFFYYFDNIHTCLPVQCTHTSDEQFIYHF